MAIQQTLRMYELSYTIAVVVMSLERERERELDH